MILLCPHQSLSRGYLSHGHTAQGKADAPTHLQQAKELPKKSKRSGGKRIVLSSPWAPKNDQIVPNKT